MHHIYNTDGLVLGGYDAGDTSRRIILLSRDVGLVNVKVQNARATSSKLRYSIQDFSVGKYSLVRGRGEWKLVGASIQDNLFKKLEEEKLKAVARVFSLLKRLVGEGDYNHFIFTTISSFVDKIEEIDIQKVKSLECIVLFRILDNLGFMRTSPKFSYILSTDKFNDGELAFIDVNLKEIVEILNQSIKVTGL